MAYELLDRDGIARVEPALELVKHKLWGALRLPNDQTGDCYLFTHQLAEHARALGVDFRFGRTIERLHSDGERVSSVQVHNEHLIADL